MAVHRNSIGSLFPFFLLLDLNKWNAFVDQIEIVSWNDSNLEMIRSDIFLFVCFF